jgi:hypothetical protein
MTQTARRQRRGSDAKEEFFLYVAFHSAFTALMKLFTDD